MSSQEISIISREDAVCLEQDDGEVKEDKLQRKRGLTRFPDRIEYWEIINGRYNLQIGQDENIRKIEIN